MRALPFVLVAALLPAAPAAEAKRIVFAADGPAKAKRTPKTAKKTGATGWRARAPRIVVTAPAPAPADAAPTPSAPAPADSATGPAAGAPAAATPVDTAPPAPACDPSPWLGAIAEDAGGFRLRLTRTCVPAGRVLLQFRNDDLAVHNLWAQGVAPAAAPREVVPPTGGETMVTAAAKLEPGTWRLFCSFEGHEAMTRLVQFTPSG